MYVIATAGHVDHGKSALLRALTGMEPDRWEAEQRRGLTIDLGFVWTQGRHGPIAFVDVPGHERFVGNMLAGVGPVPAVLFAVAADEGWMPQSAEHLAALHALGVRHGLLAITKCDVTAPQPAAAEAVAELARTSLGELPWLGVSARTGHGIDQLREALDALVSRLPESDPHAAVRLWVDRAFTMRGAGLVVTGTLAAGGIRVGDTLEVARDGRRFVVRELQSMGAKVSAAQGVARVAVNLRGAKRGDLARGDALMTPQTYHRTTVTDVRLYAAGPLPPEVLVHIGSAAVGARLRPLGQHSARLTLSEPLPLRVGDRVVLRHDRGVAGGAVVLDVAPAAFGRKGAARLRAEELCGYSDHPDGRAELRRRGVVQESTLRAIGVTPPVQPLTGGWLVDPDLAGRLAGRLATLITQRSADAAAAPLKAEEARSALDLPDVRLVAALLPAGLHLRDGMIVSSAAPDTLAPAAREALAQLETRWRDTGFAALPEADLAVLAPAQLAAAVRGGRLVRLAGVVVLPAAIDHAMTTLAGLPQPFTVGEAREALATSRKVIVPLLEHTASRALTRRLPDGRHTMA